MSVITHNRRRSRLSKIIDEAGGVSIGAALTAANANLAALKPRSVAEVSQRIAELAAVTQPRTPEEAKAVLGVVYKAANGVIDCAGPFGMQDLCAVALGLCDLIDAATADRPFDWRVLPVYAQSLQLLLALGDNEEARRTVRESLDMMVDRKLAQPG